MKEMALEGNTMLYRHSPITINENHTKMAFLLILLTCNKQNTTFTSRTYGVIGIQTRISDALSLRLRASEMPIFIIFSLIHCSIVVKKVVIKYNGHVLFSIVKCFMPI